MNRRTIIIALAVIVLVATVLMTYFGSMEDTVSPDTQNSNAAPATSAQ
jgi:flagellar basal body-associated protein FliL